MGKFKKKNQFDTLSVNLTQTKIVDSSNFDPHALQPPPLHATASENSSTMPNFPNFGHGRGNRGVCGRSRGRFGNIQCQVCFKYEHLAMMCYYCFNQHFQTPISSKQQGHQGPPPCYSGFLPAGMQPTFLMLPHLCLGFNLHS